MVDCNLPSGPTRAVGVAGWRDEELALLSDVAGKLTPHAEEIAAVWARRLVHEIGPPLTDSAQSLEWITNTNRWFLAGHLLNLRERNLQAVFHDNLAADLALLRYQREIDPELRSTLSQLYLSLRISTAVVLERVRKIYAQDPRLPDVLLTYCRLSHILAEMVGEAFYQVRSEEAQQGLRVVSSLLDTSRELNKRAASVASVLAHLNRIVATLVRCDKSLTFLWRESDSAYVAQTGMGFTDQELTEIQTYRFRRGDFPMMDAILFGEMASGAFDDGQVPREMMERYGEKVYAVAPITAPDGRRLGTLAAYRADPVPFDPTDLSILQGVAQNAALAIDNAMLVEKLESAARIKTDFINSMSHEIRTPLNVLVGYLDMLADLHCDDRQDMELLGRMRQNTGYLLGLVNTILDVARIEAGHVPLRLETFEVEEVLTTLREIFSAAGSQRGVDFSCRADEGVPPLTTDRLKLLEVLSNLVGNALKFTDQGSVTARASRAGDNGHVIFEVSDTGLGIDPAMLDTIFDVFCQAGPSDRGGTGLGLYIVKRLTTLLGGEVSVESKPGKGSTFRVRVPLETEHP